MGARYSLVINCESSYSVRLISTMADIELSSGRDAINPNYLWRFLGIIDGGLTREALIMGNPSKNGLDSTEIEDWGSVLMYCDSISAKIQKILKSLDSPEVRDGS